MTFTVPRQTSHDLLLDLKNHFSKHSSCAYLVLPVHLHGAIRVPEIEEVMDALN